MFCIHREYLDNLNHYWASPEVETWKKFSLVNQILNFGEEEFVIVIFISCVSDNKFFIIKNLQIWSFKNYHLCPLFAPKWKKMYSTQNNNREALQIHSYKLMKYWNLCKCALWIYTYVRSCQRNWLLNTFNRINLGTDWGVHRVHPPRGAGGHWRQAQGRRPNTPGKKQWHLQVQTMLWLT